jgi:hypothetical protein
MNFNFSTCITSLTVFLKKPKPNRYEWLFITSLSVVLTLFLYPSALNGYWRFDDGAHLMFATEYSPSQYFFNPVVTRAFSGANITPWNVFFYDLNLSIFGFHPAGFYFHLLFLLVCTSLALFALMRLWLPLSSSLLGIIMFLTGKPTYHITQELMCNHYLTGMLFSVLSLYFFTHYLRYGNKFKLLSSLVLYVLAMTCKEVYVPLIAILLVIPAGSYKQRIQAMVPFIAVGIGYALWRHKVLGSWIGGYLMNPVEPNILTILTIVQQLVNIPFLLFDVQGWGVSGLIIIIIMSLIAVWSRLVNLPLFAVSVFILLVPLIPLTFFPGVGQPDRYLFAPWTALSIWIAIIFQPLNRTKKNRIFRSTETAVKSLSTIVLLISSLQNSLSESQKMKGSINQAEAIYHFALEADFSKQALMIDIPQYSNYWAFVSSEARRAYDISNNLPPQPVLITDKSLNGLLILNEATKDTQFYRYHNDYFTPYNIKPLISTVLDSLKAGKDQLLQVTLSHNKDVLTWDLEPKGLSYSLLLWRARPARLQQLSEEGLPDKGSAALNINDMRISWSVKSPEGWMAVTPEFKFTAGQQKLLWRGKTNLVLVTKKLESLLDRMEQ